MIVTCEEKKQLKLTNAHDGRSCTNNVYCNPGSIKADRLTNRINEHWKLRIPPQYIIAWSAWFVYMDVNTRTIENPQCVAFDNHCWKVHKVHFKLEIICLFKIILLIFFFFFKLGFEPRKTWQFITAKTITLCGRNLALLHKKVASSN